MFDNNKWKYFEKEYPNDYEEYCVIEVINSDGSDGGHWKWSKELEKKFKINKEDIFCPMLWRYEKNWLIKTNKFSLYYN